MNTTFWTDLLPETPLGPLAFAVTESGLAALEFGAGADGLATRLRERGIPLAPRDEAITGVYNLQIREYLAGTRKTFTFPIDWARLPDFQRRVLQLTFEIPYGTTRSYGELAAMLGKPGAARAVGQAQATNPMPLVIPCHRVIGSDGKLHGYGGGDGLPTKAWLLQFERERA
ncbi:MAG: methylated-DNA--[protein]-cysteine S-methyltransferase [Anaerolineales bacterium]